MAEHSDCCLLMLGNSLLKAAGITCPGCLVRPHYIGPGFAGEARPILEMLDVVLTTPNTPPEASLVVPFGP